jgi:hypothetical protein
MQDLGDKLIINKEGKDALSEYLSRKEPGDQLRVMVDLTLDEANDQQFIFSMDKLKICNMDKGGSMTDMEDATEDDGDEKTAGDETQPVLEWAKSNMADNVPAEHSMSY